MKNTGTFLREASACPLQKQISKHLAPLRQATSEGMLEGMLLEQRAS